MSFDLGLWYPSQRLSNEEAGALYSRLCAGEYCSNVQDHPGIKAFYHDLTSRHPEIDDVPEDRIDDTDYCPWSIAFDRSPGHLILCCVWSKAEYVNGLVRTLASKHGLVVFDPQAGTAHYPPTRSSVRETPSARATDQPNTELELESGAKLLNPSPEEVAAAIHTLDDDTNHFAILARSEMTYIQTARHSGGKFVVEYQEGSLDQHFMAVRDDLQVEEVVDLFTQYQLTNPQWAESVEWKKEDLGSNRGGCISVVGILAVLSTYLAIA